MLSAIAFALCGCSDSDDGIEPVATLRIVNAIQDVGTIQLREFEGNTVFFNTTTISYRANGRFAFAPNTPVNLTVVPESDTLDIILSETLTMENAGDINTLFLLGDSMRVETLVIQDEFVNYQDSVFGVRFINLSADSQPVTVRNILENSEGERDTTLVTTDLAFKFATPFSMFSAEGIVVEHIFQFLDADGNVLASETLPEQFFLPLPRFNNFTFGLVGRTDDGSGGSGLSVLQIAHF